MFIFIYCFVYLFCLDLSDSEKGDICKDTEEETDQDIGKALCVLTVALPPHPHHEGQREIAAET